MHPLNKKKDMKNLKIKKTYQVLVDSYANMAFKSNENNDIQVVEDNLSYEKACKLVFENAKKEADLRSGDWQYYWETNTRSIYFHSYTDRFGSKRKLVGRLGDEEIQIGDYKYFLQETN